MSIEEKWQSLIKVLSQMKSVLVAYSGGVDSTFLIKVASLSLGNKAIALTGVSPTIPKREVDESIHLAKTVGIKHILIDTNEWKNENYLKNDSDRCFYCKDSLYAICLKKARELGVSVIVDGSNVDDLKDDRPGFNAARKWGVRHPLIESGWKKGDIRQKSKDLSLSTWDKGSFACLASRVHRGIRIDLASIKRIEAAEAIFPSLGFVQFRVRDFGNLAKIEVGFDELKKFEDPSIKAMVKSHLEKVGYRWVCLDPHGYKGIIKSA